MDAAADVELVESQTETVYNLLMKGLEQARGEGGNGEADEGMAYLYEELLKDHEKRLEQEASKEGSNSALDFRNRFQVGYDIILVKTIGADGQPFKMTTLVAWPENNLSQHKADNVVLCTHVTITDDLLRPTSFVNRNYNMQTDVGMLVGCWAGRDGFFSMWGSSGRECLAILPDYEGYGSTRNRPHPYLIREVQACQCYDALQQGIGWYLRNKKGFAKDNWKIISDGYSQGGAMSAATYRYVLENRTVNKNIKKRYVGAVCGDGPYDAFTTLTTYCNDNKITMPVAPLLVLKGLVEFDPEMKENNYKLSDYLRPEFLKTGIVEAIDSKVNSVSACDKCVYDYAAAHPDEIKASNGYIETSQILNADTYNYFQKGTVPADEVMAKKLKTLEHCLKKNSLFYKDDNSVWTPPAGAKFTFFHGILDDVVPHTNLESIKDNWGVDNSCCKYIDYFSPYIKHDVVGKLFFAIYHYKLGDELLDNTWKSNLTQYVAGNNDKIIGNM